MMYARHFSYTRTLHATPWVLPCIWNRRGQDSVPLARAKYTAYVLFPIWAFSYSVAVRRVSIQGSLASDPSGLPVHPWNHTSKSPIFAFYTIFSQHTQPVKKCKFSMQNPLILAKNPLNLAKNYPFAFLGQGPFTCPDP